MALNTALTGSPIFDEPPKELLEKMAGQLKTPEDVDSSLSEMKTLGYESRPWWPKMMEHTNKAREYLATKAKLEENRIFNQTKAGKNAIEDSFDEGMEKGRQAFLEVAPFALSAMAPGLLPAATKAFPLLAKVPEALAANAFGLLGYQAGQMGKEVANYGTSEASKQPIAESVANTGQFMLPRVAVETGQSQAVQNLLPSIFKGIAKSPLATGAAGGAIAAVVQELVTKHEFPSVVKVLVNMGLSGLAESLTSAINIGVKPGEETAATKYLRSKGMDAPDILSTDPKKTMGTVAVTSPDPWIVNPLLKKTGEDLDALAERVIKENTGIIKPQSPELRELGPQVQKTAKELGEAEFSQPYADEVENLIKLANIPPGSKDRVRMAFDEAIKNKDSANARLLLASLKKQTGIFKGKLVEDFTATLQPLLTSKTPLPEESVIQLQEGTAKIKESMNKFLNQAPGTPILQSVERANIQSAEQIDATLTQMLNDPAVTPEQVDAFVMRLADNPPKPTTVDEAALALVELTRAQREKMRNPAAKRIATELKKIFTEVLETANVPASVRADIDSHLKMRAVYRQDMPSVDVVNARTKGAGKEPENWFNAIKQEAPGQESALMQSLRTTGSEKAFNAQMKNVAGQLPEDAFLKAGFKDADEVITAMSGNDIDKMQRAYRVARDHLPADSVEVLEKSMINDAIKASYVPDPVSKTPMLSVEKVLQNLKESPGIMSNPIAQDIITGVNNTTARRLSNQKYQDEYIKMLGVINSAIENTAGSGKGMDVLVKGIQSQWAYDAESFTKMVDTLRKKNPEMVQKINAAIMGDNLLTAEGGIDREKFLKRWAQVPEETWTALLGRRRFNNIKEFVTHSSMITENLGAMKNPEDLARALRIRFSIGGTGNVAAKGATGAVKGALGLGAGVAGFGSFLGPLATAGIFGTALLAPSVIGGLLLTNSRLFTNILQGITKTGSEVLKRGAEKGISMYESQVSK